MKSATSHWEQNETGQEGKESITTRFRSVPTAAEQCLSNARPRHPVMSANAVSGYFRVAERFGTAG